MNSRPIRYLIAGLVLLVPGAGLIYFGWQPRGREAGLALGILLVGASLPLLLYAITHLRR